MTALHNFFASTSEGFGYVPLSVRCGYAVSYPRSTSAPHISSWCDGCQKHWKATARMTLNPIRKVFI